MLSSCCLFLLHFALWLEFRWPSQHNQPNINGGQGLCLAPMLHSLILLSATQGSLFPWQHILLSLFKPPHYLFLFVYLSLSSPSLWYLLLALLENLGVSVGQHMSFPLTKWRNSQVMLMDLSLLLFCISLDQTPYKQFRAFTEKDITKQISNRFM